MVSAAFSVRGKNLANALSLTLQTEIGAIYGFESTKIMPDVRLSLDVGQVIENKTSPRFTITYVNGQTSPMFRNYNALLAALKLPF